ncbi:lysozyme 2-like [Pollicipes pollicipes]|uniref:lysozyme 2-like n=1 Tax=Pollicipes pollicipes TaxID=41117 RepID=UPI001884F1EA|nr:lysozyme 2-like [Pollicipes pollicipes]XP_037093951.1 lysozyme 2-like [Pollicipes pollicipes]
MQTYCVVAAVLVALAGLASGQELVSSTCLGCICEASTACNTTLGCTSAGYCGPFLISRAFFLDSELQQEANFASYSYESCTSDPFCSAAVIRKYMAKYPRDCDGDGLRTCSDYAMVHKTGPNSCANNQAALNSEYWKRFLACLSFYPNA